jgi:hypothetical protein
MTDAPDVAKPSPMNAPPPYPDKPREPPWTYGDGSTRSNPNATPHWVPYPHPWER